MMTVNIPDAHGSGRDLIPVNMECSEEENGKKWQKGKHITGDEGKTAEEKWNMVQHSFNTEQIFQSVFF